MAVESIPASGISVQRLQCFKTKKCRFWLEGRCTRGDRCTYAHTDCELRVPPDLTKTKICTRWKRGTCESLADECAYAHGMEDLRTPAALRSMADNTCDKKGSLTRTPLTNRSIVTAASTVSTACSNHRRLDSIDHIMGSEALYAHDKSGSSATLYTEDDEDDDDDVGYNQDNYTPSCAPRPLRPLNSPAAIPTPRPLRRFSIAASSSQREHKSEDLPVASPTITCPMSPIETPRGIEGLPPNIKFLDAHSHRVLLPSKGHSDDYTDFEGGCETSVWQALAKSLLGPYCD